MNYIFKLYNERIGFPLKWRYLMYRLSKYLNNVNTVLDLGASDGRLSNELSKKNPMINFIGVDTHVQPRTFIPIKKYDGKKLPFPDDSFDCVMIIDVLHHDENPEEVLKEAKRVSKKYILIKDHYWKNKFDFLLLKYADYIGNKPYGIKLPYKFIKIINWHHMIERADLKIIDSSTFRYNLADPARHIIFQLQK